MQTGDLYTAAGFDYWNILPDQGHYYNPTFIKMGTDTVYSGYVTDVTTDLALDWIGQNRGQLSWPMITATRL